MLGFEYLQGEESNGALWSVLILLKMKHFTSNLLNLKRHFAETCDDLSINPNPEMWQNRYFSTLRACNNHEEFRRRLTC